MAVTDPLRSTQALANVALFVPAGVLWTARTGRPLRVLVALILLSATIEVVQDVTVAGANDVGDLLANTVGAALGVAVGWLVVALQQDRDEGRPPGGTIARFVAGVVVVGVVVTAAAQIGAGAQLRSLKAELAAIYDGTTLGDVERWQDEDRFSEMVFDAPSVRADGMDYRDSEEDGQVHVRARYPATFLSARRCVFVRWTEDDVHITGSRGQDCSRFIG